MRKILLSLFFFAGIVCVWLFPDKLSVSNQSTCAFCDPKVLSYQKFYEDDQVVALYNYMPVLPGHCLIIPKRHAERFEELSEEEITYMGRAVKKVHEAAIQVFGASSYRLVQRNGREVGQTVPHVHIHYLPQKAGTSCSDFLSVIRTYVAHLKGPIPSASMQDAVQKMHVALNSHHNENQK